MLANSSLLRSLRLVGAVVMRPRLWPTALRLLVESAPRGWWRRAPWLPVPDAGYLAFRVSTAYGASGQPSATDVVEYLDWVRLTRQAG